MALPTSLTAQTSWPSKLNVSLLPRSRFIITPPLLRYITRIEAPKAAYPVLLGNGNLKEQGTLAGGERHFAIWEDPFPKPCYLFALVAGNLAAKERVYRTGSGRDVTLRIFVQEQNISKVCEHQQGVCQCWF